jgi:TrmH family RNA methyltransferase
MERVADTVTPQALCAVVGAIDRDLGALLDRGLVLVCVDVRDPGNLGAVLRSAAAAGADGVICCSGTVDLYNPKAVRSSAGALFQVPIAIDAPIADALSQLATAGYRCWATVVRGGVDYTEADLAGATALVLGNEAAGLPDQVVARLGGSLTIPMASATESLNVAMTAAVLSFEAARQRRASSAAG